MSTQQKKQSVDSSPVSGIATFMAYRGASGEHLGEDHAASRWLDALATAILSLFIVRNGFYVPHPIVWLYVTMLGCYVALLTWNPKNINNLRVLTLGIFAIIGGAVMPIRLEEPVLVTSYVVSFGCMALFFVYGTMVSLVATLCYAAYVAIMLHLDGGYSIGYIFTMVSTVVVVITIAIIMLHHFMVRLEATNQQLTDRSEALKHSLDSLQYSAAAGGVGLWQYDPHTDVWEVNEVFRSLTDLPHTKYPELNSDIVLSRIPEEARAGTLLRLRGNEHQDVEFLEVLKADGSRIRCQGMSRFYAMEGGRAVRHGMLIAAPE